MTRISLKVTKRLAEHATCNLRNRRYLQTIQWLINKFSRHMGRVDGHRDHRHPAEEGADQANWSRSTPPRWAVRCTSTRWSTRPVLGGMRIQVGDEVTDNTVVAQLQNLHRKVQTEATPA